MTATAGRPVTVLIAALGGEGGGVLTNWIVRAAEAAGLMVQSTSIPGVAQRTGATTYYIEIFPTPLAELDGRRPVLSLFPSVGDVDVMVASEIVEAGRAIHNGFVTPNRTTLIASTHRIYAIGERAAMADGRFDIGRIAEAAARQSRNAVLADFAAVARSHGSVLNAVLLGIVAAGGVVPVPSDAFRDAIRADGRAVESNLAGFEAGLVLAPDSLPVRAPDAKRPHRPTASAVEARVAAGFPDAVHAIVVEGVRRLIEYQGPRYAGLYLDRLAEVRDAEAAAGGDMTLTREAGRHLALWMSYEDVIRVGQAKAHPDRYRRVLDEVRAGDGEPVRITEFFKPGIEELCSILPPSLARPIMRLSQRRGWLDRVYVGMHVKSTTINGFLRLWLLAKLKVWRPRTWRYHVEQARIAEWLDQIIAAVGIDRAFALEVAECARLIKGYGDTHRRGVANYVRIRDAVIAPALAGETTPARAADAVANARAAALADPAGARLATVLESIAAVPVARAAE